MTTWAEWRKAAETPFKDGERVRMEGGKAYKARVPKRPATRRELEAPIDPRRKGA